MSRRLAPKFAIFSGEHQMFWREGGRGYTANTFKAGQWYRHQAERIVENLGPEKMISICEVRR